MATVKIGQPDQIGDAYLNREPAVIMTILKQPDINTIALTSDVEAALKELEISLPRSVQINSRIFRQSDFINTAVNNVFRVMLEGGLYVTLILFLFLLNVRTTLISLIAIPLSLMLSIIVLRVMGLTINTMSLGGMAIAIGALVDDAIIDVENVLKRLKQNHKKPKGEQLPVLQVIYHRLFCTPLFSGRYGGQDAETAWHHFYRFTGCLTGGGFNTNTCTFQLPADQSQTAGKR